MRQQNPRGKGERLRQDILAAAFAVLDEEGTVEAIRLRAVARAAGITAPAIYAHFASVEDLIIAMRDIVFTDMIEHTDAAAAAADGPVEALVARAQAYVVVGIRAPARRRLMFTPIAGEANRIGLASFEGLVELVAECVAAGRSRSVDPWADTAYLLAALDGLVQGNTVMVGFPWPPLEAAVRDMTIRLVLLDP